ncbi:MAG: glycosyltransferase [Pedobacter sp.]|nr:glycosyltransferase [Pedobacter sp.]
MLTELLELAQSFLLRAASDPALLAVALFPMVLLLEMPYIGLICLGVCRFWLRQQITPAPEAGFLPKVSCVITCYSEGRDVQRTILSLLDQDYAGVIEILPAIDGAKQNAVTLRAAQEMMPQVVHFPRRELKVLPKWLRGGRVSGLNTGLSVATGQIVMALDGDTSFDRDMVRLAVDHFRDPDVVALAGSLRVRNLRKNLITRLQAVEYVMSLQFSRAGLAEFNIVNNVSGAHGIFRTAFLRKMGGWDNGTAEDLDLTLRIKKYFSRHPELRITSDPYVIGHTDVPHTLKDFFNQRLRWDGDLAYLYFRKHHETLRPSLMGWKNFLVYLWSGLLFQVILPPILILSLLYLLVFSSAAVAIFSLLLSYVFYLGLTLFMYLLHLLLVSERPREDAGLIWVLPLFPFFAMATRIWSALAIAHSLLLRSHLDSSMAPWWVLKKGKF